MKQLGAASCALQARNRASLFTEQFFFKSVQLIDFTRAEREQQFLKKKISLR